MGILAEIIVSIFIIMGALFGVVGSFGLFKLTDTMQRLHAPTKAATIGVWGVLIASALYALLVKGQVSFHEILIALFLLLTGPITANFISKVYIQANKSAADLPNSTSEHGWAVYDEPPAQ